MLDMTTEETWEILELLMYQWSIAYDFPQFLNCDNSSGNYMAKTFLPSEPWWGDADQVN